MLLGWFLVWLSLKFTHSHDYSVNAFLRRVINSIATFFSLPAPSSISDDELVSSVRTWLTVASARGLLVLIIDGVELFDAVGRALYSACTLQQPFIIINMHLPIITY